MNLWPHQPVGIQKTLDAIDAGNRRICLCSPTGMGKSLMVCEIIDRVAMLDWYVVLYTNRLFLIEQLGRVLTAHGIDYGVRAAGHSDEDSFQKVQISSLPTESKRTIKTNQWDIHGGGRHCLAVCDEAHLNCGPTAQEMQRRHLEAGHYWLGITATPLDIGHMYDHLIVAGTTSEGRDCGALVPCLHYGPDEPDLREFKKIALGQDLTEKEAVKAMMRPGVFGRVLDEFNLRNPDRRPTIMFAPGVKESKWFAEQFVANGITAAHIDGEEVWINGKSERTSQAARDRILEGSRNRDICLLCNRFVLREGIDAPWLAHGIFATVFGALQSYVQSGGRLLRSYPGVASVTLSDHGGNWHRHGSLNANREWNLQYSSTIVSGLRDERLRNKQETEPYVCPQCKLILNRPICRLCGYEVPFGKKSRSVVQSDGTLKEMRGDIFKRRPISHRIDGPERWKRMYFRSRTAKGDRSFRSAAALFARENNWQWPDPTWPYMPVHPLDWFKRVVEVPMNRLVPPGGQP